MRNKPPPGFKRVSDWTGKRVRLARDISNGAGKYPMGMEATVESTSPGLRLIGDACPHCGVRMYITRVPSDDVVLADSASVKP